MYTLTTAQIEALAAAVDVAYDDTPPEDAERLEMENQARQALQIIKTPVPPATPARSLGNCEMCDTPTPAVTKVHRVLHDGTLDTDLVCCQHHSMSDPSDPPMWAMYNSLTGATAVSMARLAKRRSLATDLAEDR